MKLRYDYEDKRDYDKCDYCDKKDYYDKKCCDDHKYDRCYPKNPCPYPILFECACGTGAVIPGIATALEATPFAPRALGCVTIDTTCLKNPVVKFDFTSIIRFLNTSGTLTPTRLTFGLFKKCNDGDEILCGTWDFALDFDDTTEQITTSYSFSHCECNSCPGCCTYSVRIIAATNVGLDNTLDVYNPTLSIIAKSAC